MLKLHLVDLPSVQGDDALSQASTIVVPTLKAVKVSPQEFAKLLFCDISTHRRKAYIERMEMLATQLWDDSSSLNTSLGELVLGTSVLNLRN